MSGLLQRGMVWLADQLKLADTTLILYARGELTLTTTAALGKQLLRITDLYGNTQMIRPDADVLLTRPADFARASIDLPPLEGDQATINYPDGTALLYEVAALGGEEPWWRWSDQQHTILRVHMRYVRTVGAVPLGALFDEAGNVLLEE